MSLPEVDLFLFCFVYVWCQEEEGQTRDKQNCESKPKGLQRNDSYFMY